MDKCSRDEEQYQALLRSVMESNQRVTATREDYAHMARTLRHQGMSLKDIAHHMGRTVATIRSYLRS